MKIKIKHIEWFTILNHEFYAMFEWMKQKKHFKKKKIQVILKTFFGCQ